MRKTRFFIGGGAVAALIVALALVLPAFAATPRALKATPRPNVLKLERQIRPKSVSPANYSRFDFNCGTSATAANRVINVTELIINDADSGTAGNYWAYDHFTRTIQVWNIGPDLYCAAVNYDGSFVAVGGQTSPGNTGTLTGDEHGRMLGGYQTTNFTGQLNVNDPAHWPTSGLVRPKPVDYQCDINGNCPGAIDWTTKYFANLDPTFNLASWGWRYTAQDARDGIWTNASSGNGGDILDVD
ncbi:MAG: hypothetical protein IVW57_13350 [Ktedonobacterales bacterium]|nr:hypothetical protein [Ktedonobacterales bacterium]